MQRSRNEKLSCGFLMRKRTENHPAFLHYFSVMFLVFIRGSTDGPVPAHLFPKRRPSAVRHHW